MTRRGIREIIFQIIFKAEFNSREDMEEQIQFSIDKIIHPEEDPEDVAVEDIGKVKDGDLPYIEEKAKNILGMLPKLDEIIEQAANGWQLSRLGKPELAILRLAVYEMFYDDDIPFKVAINEAVELSKKFCNAETSGFINGVLSTVKEPE